MQAAEAISASEQALITVVRNVPPERLAQVMDFARFIVWQPTHHDEGALELEEEDEEAIRADEAKWDRLFARPEAQQLMVEMAREALAEAEAGLAWEMEFDDEGNLVAPS